MNNINCEHCGTLIDVLKDTRCPNCGAPYKNNKQYKEYLLYKQRQMQIDLETKQLSNDITKDVHNTQKNIIPGIFIFMIVIIFAVAIFMFQLLLNFEKDFENIPDDYFDPYEYNNNNNYENVNGNFNENIITSDFDIKVDKIIKYNEVRFTNDKEMYYGFHIVFNNKTDNWKVLNNIALSYINESGSETYISKSIVSTKELDFLATKKQTYEGYLYYKIDNDIKDVYVTFENATISIPDFRNKIK